MTGTVGPGFTITLKKAGTKVTTLKAGTYNFLIIDKAAIHNFHLTGPGPKSTRFDPVLSGLGYTGQKRYQGKTAIKLTPGMWHYVCDPHSFEMKGSFKVTR